MGLGLIALDGVVFLSCLGLSYVLYSPNIPRPHDYKTSPRAYVLHSITTHARLLPADSRHAFTYPVLSLILPLSALESARLSLLNGFLFSYGGTYGRILGLRSAKYLFDDGGKVPSIRTKLIKALDDFGVGDAEEQLDDAWILTMPSYCGYEGLNPLTVYFCYRKDNRRLWIVVLEIHNTFGERHVHILEVGRNEEAPNANFDHQWSFPRAFHVSPFNDRLGTYTVSVRAPFSHSDSDVALPHIRIHLNNPTGDLKFSASLRAKHVAPFRTLTVLAALATHPFILFLTLPRILRQAAVLHYRRHLDVYKRPEPKPVSWSVSPSHSPALAKGGGIGWQHPTILERAARHFANAFLARRAHALGVCIKLRPSDPSAHVQHFDAGTDGADGKFRELVISYLSPHFFTLLVLAGDGPTALRWGGSGGPSHTTGEVREFLVSDEASFREVFDIHESGGATWPARVLRLLPDAACRHEQDVGGGKNPHPLMPESWIARIGFAVLLCALVAMEWAEELLWRIGRVRWAVIDSMERHPSGMVPVP
ncbi:hypothetical protein BGW80DRAFT_1176686 [Lactifluus volemus]|nr:hypothetical protein BGW80DRAFT_1176686 [Lactifluus volemus]